MFLLLFFFPIYRYLRLSCFPFRYDLIAGIGVIVTGPCGVSVILRPQLLKHMT